MAAYMIVLAEIDDTTRFTAYARAVADLLPRFGGRYLVRAPTANLLLEGDWPERRRVVVSEWPSIQAARSFWESPEYAQIRTLREGAARVEVRLVEGA